MKTVGFVSQKKEMVEYTWEIPGFFWFVENKEIHTLISPEFSCLGGKWQFNLNAEKMRNGEVLHSFVWNTEELKDSKTVFYTGCVKKLDGTVEESSTSSRVFHSIAYFPFYLGGLDLSYLKEHSSELVPAGTLTITCSMQDFITASQSHQTSELDVPRPVDVVPQSSEKSEPDVPRPVELVQQSLEISEPDVPRPVEVVPHSLEISEPDVPRPVEVVPHSLEISELDIPRPVQVVSQSSQVSQLDVPCPVEVVSQSSHADVPCPVEMVSRSSQTSELDVPRSFEVVSQSSQTSYLDVPRSAEFAPSELMETDTLARDLESLLRSGHASDATVRVKGQDFQVHRAILGARTPAFSAEFRHDQTQGGAPCVVNVEGSEPDTFHRFLMYVYSGWIGELTPENAVGLYELANRYKMDPLRQRCLDCIKSGLSVGTFCHVYSLVLRHDQEELTKLAADFFTDNIKKIIRSKEWQTFLHENTVEGNELLIKALGTE